MDLTGQGTGLSTAKIFATMELMVLLKYNIKTLTFFSDFFFEIKIVFERLCTILNIENTKMILID
jgi:hypothetical protein